jgi:hypothetical protein
MSLHGCLIGNSELLRMIKPNCTDHLGRVRKATKKGKKKGGKTISMIHRVVISQLTNLLNIA